MQHFINILLSIIAISSTSFDPIRLYIWKATHISLISSLDSTSSCLNQVSLIEIIPSMSIIHVCLGKSNLLVREFKLSHQVQRMNHQFQIVSYAWYQTDLVCSSHIRLIWWSNYHYAHVTKNTFKHFKQWVCILVTSKRKLMCRICMLTIIIQLLVINYFSVLVSP